MSVPDVRVQNPVWTGSGAEGRLLPASVSVGGQVVFRHPIHPTHRVPVAVYMNEWIYEHPRSKDDQLVERLLVADDAPYHSRVFIYERDRDETELLLSDIHSTPYHITDMLPVVVDPNSVYRKPKPRKTTRADMTYSRDHFTESEVLLVVGKEVSGDSVLFLLDPKSARHVQVLSKSTYCQYRGYVNCLDGKLRFEVATVWLDFHYNGVSRQGDAEHSVDITRHLEKVAFSSEKTAIVHQGVKRAYPLSIGLDIALQD